MYCCVSIFQLISSLPTYPPTTVNLTYTYLHLFYSRCFSERTYIVTLLLLFHVHPLIHCVFLCKYLSTYFFITYIPIHKCKFNLYLPLPIPLQIIHVFDCCICGVWSGACPSTLVHQNSYCLCLCKYLSTYFFITYIPTHKWKLHLYLPFPIPFQMLFVENMVVISFRSTLKSLGVILGGGLNIKVL